MGTYWTPGLPEGVLSNRPCPSVCLCVRPSVCPSVRVSVFEYLRDRSLVFSNFLLEVRAPQGYKSDRPDVGILVNVILLRKKILKCNNANNIHAKLEYT